MRDVIGIDGGTTRDLPRFDGMFVSKTAEKPPGSHVNAEIALSRDNTVLLPRKKGGENLEKRR